jgi:hypothetical protein
MATKRKKNPFWSKPTLGHKKVCTYVLEKLWDDFKGVCEQEEVTITEGVKQALENWTYYDENDTKG